MTRNEKIEKLVSEIYGANECEVDDVKEAILAGIKLRGEELLAMEYDEDAVAMEVKRIIQSDDVAHWGHVSWAKSFARWQFEQFMKAIKGDG